MHHPSDEKSAVCLSNYPLVTILLLEKTMATHSSTLAWKIPWTEEPGRLQSTGLWRVRHDRATSLSLFTFMHWRRKWQPTPVFSCLENPRDGGAWWAAVYGVTQSRTWLKWLSSSSSNYTPLTSIPVGSLSWLTHLPLITFAFPWDSSGAVYKTQSGTCLHTPCIFSDPSVME